MIRVKMFITIEVDDEEYPVPADGRVGEELEEESDVEKIYDGNVIHLNFNSKTRGSA